MSATSDRVIAISKSKVVLLLVGACVFVAVGLWMFLLDDAEILQQRRYNNPAFVHGIGLASMVFFGLCGAVALRKLIDNRPGLVMSDAGFIDNASAVSAGFVPWSDVADLRLYELRKQKMLVIVMADTGKYVERGNAFRRMLNRANAHLCGSPVVIASTALKISFDELFAAFGQYRHKMAGGRT
jgi:hypothetical protein